MLIRSQDKKTIINFNMADGISTVNVMGSDVIKIMAYKPFAVNGDYASETIGIYSTEEKALKVLDMIQNKYLEYYHLKGGQAILKGTIDIAENMWEVPKVFQMPQESEVE